MHYRDTPGVSRSTSVILLAVTPAPSLEGMPLRCLLFTSDMGTAAPICHVLADLAVEIEHSTEAATAAGNLAEHPFQIVIVDWDMQPEADELLQAARERKANERPLTLAIVSDDASVPKALQAGANSILRKPILASQAKDTLTTARDLLRARQSAPQAAAASAGASAGTTTSLPSTEEATLRAGEFLQTSAPSPASQYDTESEMQKSLEQSATAEIDPLKDLEPMAADVVQQSAAPAPPAAQPPVPDEPRGLEWYLKNRAGAGRQTVPAPPLSVPGKPAPDKPELLGFDQIPSLSDSTKTPAAPPDSHPEFAPTPAKDQKSEENAEAELFAYMAGEGDQKETKEKPQRSSPRLGKGAIVAALVLAAGAVFAAPQAPWHGQIKTMWARGRQTMRSWLNPQPVTTQPTPAAHENFAQAGDEYKLPVAETIPDATTDPTQIRVTPMVDPTIKKPNSLGNNAEPVGVPADGSTSTPAGPTEPPADQIQVTPVQGSANQASVPAGSPAPAVTPADAPPANQPSATPVAKPMPSLPASITQVGPVHPDSVATTASTPAPARNPVPRPISTTSSAIPSSLKSQMAPATETGGNKAPETALPSIEPVAVPEATERALLTDQPAIAYPANAKVPAGTVVLQVLIGRDGTVQDAKFLQGSLAFARAAIDGAKQWKFKPYMMNGRAVSVQTLLTITFKPGQ